MFNPNDVTLDTNELKLQKAIKDGDVEEAKRLLADGADANLETMYGVPMLIACQYEQPEIVVALLENGADATVSHQGMFPLTSGGFNSHAIVFALAEAGADIEAVGKADGTVLLLCCQHGNAMSASYLISKGANAKVENSDGMTPLHWAVLKNMSTVVLGLKPISDLDKENCHGKTALDLAKDFENSEIIAILE